MVEWRSARGNHTTMWLDTAAIYGLIWVKPALVGGQLLKYFWLLLPISLRYYSKSLPLTTRYLYNSCFFPFQQMTLALASLRKQAVIPVQWCWPLLTLVLNRTPCAMLLREAASWLGALRSRIWMCYCQAHCGRVYQSSAALFLTDPNSSSSYYSIITSQKYVCTPTILSSLPAESFLSKAYLLQMPPFTAFSKTLLFLLRLLFLSLLPFFCQSSSLLHLFISDWIIDPNSPLPLNRIIHPSFYHITWQCSHSHFFGSVSLSAKGTSWIR